MKNPKVFKEWDSKKHVIELSDGMIYIKGDTMYRVHLEPIQKMEYISIKEQDDNKE